MSEHSILHPGGGRVGFQNNEILADRGHEVTIIERDERMVSDIADQWVATVIQGDATNRTSSNRQASSERTQLSRSQVKPD